MTLTYYCAPADCANDSFSYLPYVLHPFNIEGSKEYREGKEGKKMTRKDGCTLEARRGVYSKMQLDADVEDSASVP